MKQIKQITCKSCGANVKIQPEDRKCSICEKELWGYTAATLPAEIKSFIDILPAHQASSVLDEKPLAGWLVLNKAGDDIKAFKLIEGKNIIGRTSESFIPEVPIDDDKYVSREHAFITVAKDMQQKSVYILNDMGSMNGTYVNGKPERIKDIPVELRDNDYIQVGKTVLVLKSLEEVRNQDSVIEQMKRMEAQTPMHFNDLKKTSLITKIEE